MIESDAEMAAVLSAWIASGDRPASDESRLAPPPPPLPNVVHVKIEKGLEGWRVVWTAEYPSMRLIDHQAVESFDRARRLVVAVLDRRARVDC